MTCHGQGDDSPNFQSPHRKCAVRSVGATEFEVLEIRVEQSPQVTQSRRWTTLRLRAFDWVAVAGTARRSTVRLEMRRFRTRIYLVLRGAGMLVSGGAAAQLNYPARIEPASPREGEEVRLVLTVRGCDGFFGPSADHSSWLSTGRTSSCAFPKVQSHRVHPAITHPTT